MGYEKASNHDLLSAAEEVALAQQIESAPAPQAEAARRTLIESNLRLAMKMARQHSAPAHVDREDMIQDAMLGLERAVEGFDWRRGYRFSTYASWWIRQAIQVGLEQTAGSVRIPAQRTQELHTALHAVEGNIANLTPRLSATLTMATMTSLDKPALDDDSTLGERVPATGDDPLEALLSANDQRVAHTLLASLDEPNRYLVRRRFGFDGTDPATFTELSCELGVTPEAARRRVIRALQRLAPAASALAA